MALTTPAPMVAHTYDTSTGIFLQNSNRQAHEAISAFFAPLEAFSSSPQIAVSASQVVVSISYWSPLRPSVVSSASVNALGELLSSIYARPVSIRLVRLVYPYLDASILAQWLSLQLPEVGFDTLSRRLLLTLRPILGLSQGASGFALMGVKVRLAGRLPKVKVQPRMTVSSTQLGLFQGPGLSIDSASHVSHEGATGAYTVRVWLCYKLS